jgi:hypothetical protein
MLLPETTEHAPFHESSAPRDTCADNVLNRKRESTPSTVSAAKVTRAKDMCRASLQRHKASKLIRKNREKTVLLSWSAFLFFCTTRLASRQGVLSIVHKTLHRVTYCKSTPVLILSRMPDKLFGYDVCPAEKQKTCASFLRTGV